MKIEKEEFPVGRGTRQMSLILEYMLTRGSITHEECEAFTMQRGKKCTVLRSHISDLKWDLHWPIISRPEKNAGGSGTHARYFINYDALAQQAGGNTYRFEEATRAWIDGGRMFYSVSAFVEFVAAGFRSFKKPEQTAFWKDFAPMVRAHSRND